MTLTQERPRTPASAAPSTRVQSSGPRVGYLYQLDFVRTITFLLVIFMHTLTNMNDEYTGTVTNAISMNLHFTRNAFFALTGLVLAYGLVEGGARLRPLTFWRKRLPLVTIPFVLWAFAYWMYDRVVGGTVSSVPSSLGDFWNNLRWGGTNGYQLYFIFVTLQIYVLFPLIFALVRRTRRFHLQLLLASAALQVGVYAWATNWHPTTGWWGANFSHLYATFIPYQFFILLGVVTAFHRERVEATLLRYAPLVLTGAVIVVLGAQVLYRMRLADGTVAADAAGGFLPTSFVLYFALVAAVYTVGLLLARHRDRLPLLTRFAAYGAKRSFGMFLVHVMVLSALVYRDDEGLPWVATPSLPPALNTLMAYGLTVAISLAIVELLSRAPKSQWWVGRPRQRRSAASSPRTTTADGAGSVPAASAALGSSA